MWLLGSSQDQTHVDVARLDPTTENVAASVVIRSQGGQWSAPAFDLQDHALWLLCIDTIVRMNLGSG